MAAPKLRFKGFDQDWTGLKIKDLVKSLDAGVSVNSEDVEPKEDEYSVLKTSCISSGYFDENERKRVLQDGEIQRLKEPVLDDSILMSRMNTPLLVGMNAYVFKAPKNTFLPDRLWQLKIDDNKTVTRWLAFYLGSDQGLNQIRDLASGTSNSMKNITKPDVLNLDLFVPSKEEQTKIASFLSNVDEKISQLTQKHELLSQYKQGMMQKLFSQQLRFKADDGSEFGEWEKVKLGSLLIKHDEKTEFNNQYPVLTSSRHGIYFQKDYFAGQDVASADTTGYNVVPYDYFTYRHMSDDLVFKFNINTICPKGIVSTLYPVFTVKDEHLNKYFLQTILNEGQEFKNFAIMQKQGGSRTYMYFSKLSELVLTIPCLEEQTKIANFLSAIDQKIEIVAQQIEQAKQWKKGLLQQMFV
ncbi:restriction endonuclease subunit S [Acinetobacter baumannii]|nr:restriction endonuclease subunit S [Acinetobacter baumannii]MDV4318505.1 restriction endonuclease subunit S [Acinetobacter baumannii]TPU39014.1 restriction endonuclease subunit S [Acinetobacter baumannii]